MKVLLVLSAILAVAFKGAGTLHQNYWEGQKMHGPVNVKPYITGIVGGNRTTIEEHPHQISLRYIGGHTCGGSILDKYTILTAGHCVHGKDHNLFTVRAGSTIHSEGIEIKVVHIIEHEDYVPAVHINDMAILKLERPLEYNSRIRPIELQPADIPVEAGVKAEVTGWGITEQNELRVATVYAISNVECARSYLGKGAIYDQMLCALLPKQGSCQGDSGGPLTAQGRLIGVVSFGAGCAQPEYPGVYARVSSFHKFASKYM